MLRIADVMQRNPITVARGASLREVARHLSRHDASGAPVCDVGGKVVGMISKTDLVDHLAERGELRDTTVDEAMTTEIHSVSPETTLLEAVDIMVFEGVHRVIVLDERGELVGVVSSLDVLRALSKGRGSIAG